jgi:CubicO group peptidase (beta-lactamase class C family)
MCSAGAGSARSRAADPVPDHSRDAAGRACERIIRELQANDRVPAVSAAVARADRPLWTLQVGTAGGDTELSDRTQFRIGSITKTFTAVLVLQLRDAGLLGLDDPLAAHLDVPAHGDLTIRGMLSHTSGLQREPVGELWDTLRVPPAEEVIADLARAEAVLPPSRRWHYSNLAYALLGQLVARKLGATWAEVLADRLLIPLGLTDTTVDPRRPAAQGYLVEAYTDHVRPEPEFPMGGVAPAAQLWSTASDLARWALFLADPDPRVLAAGTVEEMCQPLTVTDAEQWATGWGLGLILSPQGGRVMHVGHDGAMPGFLAGAYFRRGQRAAAAVLGSSSTAGNVCATPHPLIAASLTEDPPAIEPWRPGEPAPPSLAGALGRWWSEGSEFVFSWRAGHLEARAAGAAADRPPAVFAVEGADRLRVVSGRETGELLELTRDADGRIILMRWATYRVTRDQQTFHPGGG